MPIRSSIYRCSAVFTLLAFFAASALGQAPSSSSAGMEQEIEDLRAENAAVREQLKTLIDTVKELKQRLDGEPATVVRESPPPPPTQPLTEAPLVASLVGMPPGKPVQTASIQTPAANAVNTSSAVAQATSAFVQPEPVVAPQTNSGSYSSRDGLVIWETPENAKVPFLLNFQINTQVRYLNTLDTNRTFTDHLGVTHDVHDAQRYHGKSRNVHLRRLHFRQEGAI